MITKSIKILALLFVFGSTLSNVQANEGMWIPSLLKKLNAEELKQRGLKIPIDRIWNTEDVSIKDAIVHFGGGCTAEVVSYQGLLLTNHHCGYSQIQAHSSLENDYLKNGFWARTLSDELPNPGLTATFIVRMDDVSDKIFAAALDEKGRIDPIKYKAITSKLIKAATEGTHYEAEVTEFNYGNSYFLIVSETFKDVRLVGAPPSSIGKFGGDTDNWMWPRHTGDFSVFRIYADKNNNPAEYSTENVPYKPKYSLPVSTVGAKEGDFTMVFGFPGRTQQFLSAAAVEQTVSRTNPNRIKMRETALNIIDADMRSSDLIRIQYAAKQARISNAYKKWIGETKGLLRLNAIERKKQLEEEYVALASKSPMYSVKYSNIPARFDELFKNYQTYAAAYDYFIELVFSGPEFFRFVQRWELVVENFDKPDKQAQVEELITKNKSAIAGYFKNYSVSTDEKLFKALFPLYLEGTPKELLPDNFDELIKKYKYNWSAFASDMYNRSAFTNETRLNALVANVNASTIKKIQKDPAYQLMKRCYDAYRFKVEPTLRKYNNEIENLMNDYVAGMMKLYPDKKFWFDANSTLRLSFGAVEGSKPHDGLIYDYYTTLSGVLDKYVKDDPEFDLPQKLIELAKKRDFGQYGTDGELRVCFTASNHTTGGNSGSPVLDAYGNLIGLNFDRSWESTMSDIMYDPEICRNIILDVRYVLFIMDKYAGAKRLIDEMNLMDEEKIKDLEKDKFRDQIKALTSSIEKDPKVSENYYQRAQSYMELSDIEKAITDIEKALVLEPSNLNYHLVKAELLIEQHNYKEALTVIDKILLKRKDDAQALFLRGICLSELKRFDDAIRSYSAYINSHPMDAKAYYNRGVCYYNSGKTIEGCADFMVAEKLSGQKNTWLRQQLCY